MIISASTVKDSRENVEKYVRRNLLGGIDHCVVFVDAPLPEVEEFLAGHPDATLVRAYGAWWGEWGPAGLNERQIVNAALASLMIAGFGWAEWIFALDGDEVARIDRGVLDALDPEDRAVQLLPLEAASRLHPTTEPTLFKRLLDDDEIELLHGLGLIPTRGQRAYFRGHKSGKPGVRPSRDLALGVHHAIDLHTRERVGTTTDPGLTMLHYESHDGQEFVRKWTALLTSGLDVRQHHKRAPLAQAIAALLALDLPEADTAEFLERLYVNTQLDDIETLSRLGLLVEIDPDRGERRPRPPESEISQLRELLARAYDAPKRIFRPRQSNPKALREIDKLQRGVG